MAEGFSAKGKRIRKALGSSLLSGRQKCVKWLIFIHFF